MPARQANSEPCAAAFDRIAGTYDEVFTDSAIGRAQRRIVWNEVDRVFLPGQRILEINCGTGVDALHLAGRGVEVHACDASPGMIAQAKRRAESSSLRDRVRFRRLATEEIGSLACEGPYDGVLSNFSGLNCVSNLDLVSRSLAGLVRPGGRAVLCVFGSFCLWEVLWYTAAGDVRKAFRRFRRQAVRAGLTTDTSVTVNYQSVRSLKRIFAPHFLLERWMGVGVALPPSYVTPVAARLPELVDWAFAIDGRVGRVPGLRAFADHALLTFKRNLEGGS
jgi:ubiquinone/menaquinone biosynthesis C-methylase UbiE